MKGTDNANNETKQDKAPSEARFPRADEFAFGPRAPFAATQEGASSTLRECYDEGREEAVDVALPREFRLKGRNAFEEFRSSGEVYYSRGLVLKVVRGKRGRRFGFIVPRRISVRRNRMRRVLSEWIRLHLDLFPDGAHYLILVRSATEETEAIHGLRDLAGRVSFEE